MIEMFCDGGVSSVKARSAAYIALYPDLVNTSELMRLLNTSYPTLKKASDELEAEDRIIRKADTIKLGRVGRPAAAFEVSDQFWKDFVKTRDNLEDRLSPTLLHLYEGAVFAKRMMIAVAPALQEQPNPGANSEKPEYLYATSTYLGNVAVLGAQLSPGISRPEETHYAFQTHTWFPGTAGWQTLVDIRAHIAFGNMQVPEEFTAQSGTGQA